MCSYTSALILLLCSYARATSLGQQPSDDYVLYPDVRTPVNFQRTSVDGPAAQVLFRYLPNQGINKVNETHVFVPFSQQLQANYVRRIEVNNLAPPADDWGVAKWDFSEHRSILGVNVIVGAAGKFHVLGQNNEECHDYVDQVKAAKDSRWGITNLMARNTVGMRNALLMSYNRQSGLGNLFYQAQLDQSHIEKLFEYADVDADAGKEHKQEIDDLREVATKVDEILRSAKMEGNDPTVLGTSVLCQHFDYTTGLSFGDGGMYVQLDKHMVLFGGDLGFTQEPRVNVMNGVSSFHYNEETDMLEQYYLISGFSHFAGGLASVSDDWQGAHCGAGSIPNREYLGPVDGNDAEPAAGFSRPQAPEDIQDDFTLTLLYDTIKNMPIDYEYLSQDPEEACPQEVLDDLHATSVDLGDIQDKLAFMVSGRSPTEFTLGEIAQYARWVQLVIEIFPCVIVWFRSPVQQRDLTGIELMHVFGLMHAMLEIPGDLRIPVLASRHWDDLLSLYPSDESKNNEETGKGNKHLAEAVSGKEGLSNIGLRGLSPGM